MLNTLLEFLVPLFQKIALGGAMILAFLGIFPNTDIASSTPKDTLHLANVTQTETEEPYIESILDNEAVIEIKEVQKTQKIKEEIKTADQIPAPASQTTEASERAVETIKNIAPALTPTPALELIPQVILNEEARKIVVNVFCLTKTSGILSPITGSGVIIDKKGVILTNAHVAQYFLLKDYGTKDFLNCVIRGGSPAIPLYKAELLYLPPIWIEKNALNIKLDRPTGTGEDDYALLLLTESTRPDATLPETIPATAFDTSISDIGINDPALIASYPAGFLGGLDIAKNLWLTSSISRIVKLYTFQDIQPYTEDSFSVGGTIVAQEGASGGGIFSLKTGKLIGLIATSLLEGETDKRDLRAISMWHINESMKKNTGEDLETFLSGNLEQKSSDFNSATAPRLTKILTDLLDNQ